MPDNDLIERYRAEYRSANAGLTGEPLWAASNGWYKIGHSSYRAKDVERMIENLNSRAAEKKETK